jgi:phosphoglycerate kinase
MNKKTIRDIDVAGKRVLVRVDFNVPLDENRKITDDRRIKAALPTINYLLEKGGRAILVSHLGRPKGQVVDKLRLDPVAERLSELLGRNVLKLDDSIGPDVERAVASMKDGDLILLENIRFYSEEEKNDPDFSCKLAALADVYVNDAFGTAHRAHASTEGVAHYIKPAVAGFLMEKELDYLGRSLENPERPFVAVLGGAKVSDKIPVIENLLNKVDTLLIGGGMAYTFLYSLGHQVGRSLLEADKVEMAAELLRKAKEKKVVMLLPVDVVITSELAEDAETHMVDIDSTGSLSKRLLAKVVALIEEGKAEVKANPRLTVLNGYEALINVGKQLNYKITTEQGSAGSTYITTRIQTIHAGTTLKIVPWVGASGDITVDIHPEVSNVSGITADGLPEVSQRRVDTSIRVKDGQSISIGGLISSEELHNQTKIPLLGDLPLVGSLFSNKTKTTRDSELVIFITPHLLDMGEIE